MPYREYCTNVYEGLLAETSIVPGYNNNLINAYFARPLGPGPYPGVVVIHHLPGWDEWYKEATRKFAYHGYLALCPNLYFRFGHGSPDDVAAKARGVGGVSDDEAVGDIGGALRYLKDLPTNNGKVGVFGGCSGGRHAFLAACKIKSIDAAIDCWGGKVVASPEELNSKQPVAPIEFTKDLSCPILGLFGEEDSSPTPQQVAVLESALKKYQKNYEFHIYPKAGHSFFHYDKPSYRQEQAVDGWKRIFTFFERNLNVAQ